MKFNLQTPADRQKASVAPHKIYNGADGYGALTSMAAGGDYTGGTGSGVFSLEMRPQHDKDIQIGLRCVFTIEESFYQENKNQNKDND